MLVLPDDGRECSWQSLSNDFGWYLVENLQNAEEAKVPWGKWVRFLRYIDDFSVLDPLEGLMSSQLVVEDQLIHCCCKDAWDFLE
jgi:hypothetical protein